MTAKKQCFIIGDIHGFYDELLALEEKITSLCHKKKVKPFFVSVGDLVDRGPKVKEVVEHFKKGAKLGTHLAIAGNHEALFLTVYYFFAKQFIPKNLLKSPPKYIIQMETTYQHWQEKEYSILEFSKRVKDNWLWQGGNDTLLSYGCNPDNVNTWKIPSDHIKYLSSLPLLWENKKCLVTHGAANKDTINLARELQKRKSSQKCLFFEESRDFLENILWSREMDNKMYVINNPVDYNKFHVFGHTPEPRPILLNKEKAVKIDTGCYRGNLLTAWCIESKKFLSVPCLSKK